MGKIHKLNRLNKVMLMTICIAGLLTGCSKTPIQALQSDTAYNGYGDSFWVKERLKKTALWAEAKDYCGTNTTKPNCLPVIRQILFDGSTDVPKYGSSGHYLTVPNF